MYLYVYMLYLHILYIHILYTYIIYIYNIYILLIFNLLFSYINYSIYEAIAYCSSIVFEVNKTVFFLINIISAKSTNKNTTINLYQHKSA